MTDEEFNEFLSEKGITEEYFLNYCIEAGNFMLSYKNIAKLEELGLKVITVETPYGTKRYTTNLGGTVECGFCKNGTYEFKITVGGKTITQEVEIENIRTYDNTQPHTVKIEARESSRDAILYSVDDSSEWEEISMVEGSAVSVSNDLKITWDVFNTETWALSYVIKDADFYKTFSGSADWKSYYEILFSGGYPLALLLSGSFTRARHGVFNYVANCMMDVAPGILSTFLSSALGDGEAFDCMDDYYLYQNGEMDLDSLYNKHPKLQIVDSSHAPYSKFVCPEGADPEEAWDAYRKENALHLEITEDSLILICAYGVD